MPITNIAPGVQVAILPTNVSPPRETLEIGTVVFVDDQIVRLTDERMYSRHDRCGLTFYSRGYIELATPAHHAAVEWAVVEA
jgi:hypothetical protein